MDAAKRIKGVDEGTNERVFVERRIADQGGSLSVLVPVDLSSFTSSAINKTFVSLLTRIHCLSQFLFLNMKLVELGEGENR